MKRSRERGSSLLELMLVLIPLIFVSLGTFELGRALWSYHTLNAAIKQGVRYAIVHGEDCVQATPSCMATVGDVVGEIRSAAVGLDAGSMNVTLSAGTASVDCRPLTSCSANDDQWPPATANSFAEEITIEGTYCFVSVLSSFWPNQTGGTLTYETATTDGIQF